MAVLPLSSVATQVTVVEPRSKTLPETGLETTATAPSQSSVATGRSNATWVDPPLELHSTTRSPGQVISGSTVSTTVTSKVQVELLPLSSVAVAVTVVVPIAKTDPEAGL